LSIYYRCVKDRGKYINKYVTIANGEKGRLKKMIVSIFESEKSLGKT